MERMKRAYWAHLAAGPLVGLLLGLLEFAAHAVRGAPLLLPSLLPGVLILYVLYWTLAGIAVTLLLALVRRLGAGMGSDVRLGFSILAGAAIALTAHGALVAHLFVDIKRPLTTILFGLALLMIIPLALLVRRIVPARAVNRPRPMIALVVLTLLLSLPLLLLPEKRGEGEGPSATPGKGRRPIAP